MSATQPAGKAWRRWNLHEGICGYNFLWSIAHCRSAHPLSATSENGFTVCWSRGSPPVVAGVTRTLSSIGNSLQSPCGRADPKCWRSTRCDGLPPQLLKGRGRLVYWDSLVAVFCRAATNVSLKNNLQGVVTRIRAAQTVRKDSYRVLPEWHSI